MFFGSLTNDSYYFDLKAEWKENHLPESIVLIEGEKMYCKSTAALRIARRMDGLWPMFYVFIIIPKPIRDLLYDLIARYRYKLFGRQTSCMVPGEDVLSRFV